MVKKTISKLKQASTSKIKPGKVASRLIRRQRWLRSLWFWVLGVIAVFVLLIASYSIWYNIDQSQKIQADKNKFAKIEALVDSIKVDLDKTYPNKQWEIVKYCQASRGELGNIIAISCTYGVKGATDTTVAELSPIVQRHAKSLGMYEDYGGRGIKYEAFKTDLTQGSCDLYSSSAFGVWVKANFSCTSGSESFLYPEFSR